MSVAQIVLGAGVVLLAAGPIGWLLRTWSDPAYDSPGPWVFAVIVAVFIWSWRSPMLTDAGAARPRAQRCLLGTALVRLVSHVLDVDVLGGFALIIDVYALALLCGLHARARAVAPLWLAMMFAFCLPIERILQRLVGYPLQWISAAGACGLLGLAVPDVRCAGLSIEVGGRAVLVDVPCSGARGLVTLALLFVTLSALRRPTWRRAAAGIAIAVAAAAAANLTRVTALAAGVAFAGIGIDVMAAPWHEAIGALALGLGAAPIVLWASAASPRAVIEIVVARASLPARGAQRPCRGGGQGRPPYYGEFTPALLVLAAALLLFVLPHRPVDASAPVRPLALPASLLGHPRQIQALDEKERVYFTHYGGRAVKARYGPFAVLAVTTTAPLRHLHAPDECLRGSGHSVRLVRTAFDGRLPAAVYRSVTPDGQTLRVAASFLSDRGDIATSVSEVAWRWMRRGDGVWTSLQRIVPADAPPQAAALFDEALAAALELPPVHRHVSPKTDHERRSS